MEVSVLISRPSNGEIILDSTGGPSLTTGSLNVGDKAEERVRESLVMTDAGSERCNIVDFEAGGGGHEPRDAGDSRSWKRPGNRFSSGAPRGNQPCDTLTLAQ